MVYTPTGEPFSIETKSLKGCKVKANWYNPLYGSYTAFDYSDVAGSSSGTVQKFTPPSGSGHSDWLLVLEATAKAR